MSHPKNQGDGTDDAPRKVEWTCLGLYGMAMERSCSLWRRREFWDHSVPPNTTRSTRLSLCGCDRTTSISSLRASYGNINESAQTDDLPRQPSKKYSTEADVSHIVTCSRIHQGMDPDGLENGCSPQKKSPKKPINRVCLGEESTDEPCQKAAQQIEADGGFRRHPRQGANVKSTWSGCEVKLGTCHMFHTRVPWKGHRRRQRVCGGDPYPRGLSDETTSLG